MRRLLLALVGALLAAAGIAAQIVASRHSPVSLGPGTVNYALGPHPGLGWSHTAYDAVRIGGWALIIVGAVVVLFALVRELRPGRP